MTRAYVISGAAIAAALHGRNCGSGSIALCPVHESDGKPHKPSFGITERDGRVLVRCYAGCSQADVVAALRARGVWPEREQREWAPGDRARWAHGRAEADRIRQEAAYFEAAARAMAEWALEELTPTDPERAVHTALLMALRVSPETEYRAWLQYRPTSTAALVNACRERARRLQVALARWIAAGMSGVAHAA